MWIIVLVVFVGIGWFAYRYQNRRTGSVVRELPSAAAPLGLSVSVQYSTPDPEEWARERERRQRLRQEGIARLRASFIAPANFMSARAGLEAALRDFAQALGVAPPDLARLEEMTQAESLKKRELLIRKKLNEAYKQRHEHERLVEALAWCVLHVSLCIQRGDPSWKATNFIKRIANSFDHERFRPAALGFLLQTAAGLRVSRPELAQVADECFERLFSSWHSDLEAGGTFQSDLARLAHTSRATDKHFILNGLIEYLARRRRFDAGARAKLIELCEIDVGLYKAFLAEFASIGGTALSFSLALRSPHYMCPGLPSFIALWDLAADEGDLRQLRRLKRIANEIRYDAYTNAELEEADAPETDAPIVPPKLAPPPPPDDESFVPDVVEVGRSGLKGKLAFLHPDGRPCSTEEAACGWLEQRGVRTLRGEVQFWQAMFALAFWEEIFEGTGAPNAMNDIPMDLFSGASFYDVRSARIDAKAQLIARSDVESFVLGQLRRWGGNWTRILYDGARGNFAYRATLESAGVVEFLRLVPATVFAKIVHRIATNPTEHRSGLPDYMVWKGRELCFVEVKGVREQIREGQQAWIAWMQAEGIAVKVVRVKGVSPA